jgi:uncharacterized SAM-binding protein YcdF (DUF218 family)
MILAAMNPYLKQVCEYLAQAEPDDTIPQCDGIFVFGTTTGDVAKHAARLYLNGKAPRLIISGRHRYDKTEGPFGFASEAEYLASLAEEVGVPRDKMLLETMATNTYENVVFGMRVCQEAGFMPKTLILVSIPYLLRRARACFAKNFPEIKVYGSAMPVDENFFTDYRLERIKGELPRLVKYAEGGTIAPSVIPEEIQYAAHQF